MSEPSPGWEARKLLRAARVGTLASAADGQPFASLVTPACAPDLSLLLLLSDLSEHTRHLRAEPRCSVLVTGTPEGANPQTAPRVTVTGLAERIADAALKARYLAVHPYAALYADFGDFSLWRIRPLGGLYVGGFARAARLRAADLAPEPAAVAAIDAADVRRSWRIATPITRTRLAAIAGEPGDWRMVAVDVDGCDLAQGERVDPHPLVRAGGRREWRAPRTDPTGARRQGRLMAPTARQ